MNARSENWDGSERRKVSQEDHDLLTKIDANLRNHLITVEKHIADDKEKFEKIDSDLVWIRRILYGATGIVIFIEFMSKLPQ